MALFFIAIFTSVLIARTGVTLKFGCKGTDIQPNRKT